MMKARFFAKDGDNDNYNKHLIKSNNNKVLQLLVTDFDTLKVLHNKTHPNLRNFRRFFINVE